MELKTVKITKLKPYKNNPRKNDGAVDAVAESIQQCEYVAPIIVDENLEILAGHTRLKALMKLGRKEAEVVIKSGLTEEQKRKFRLLDNKTNEFAKWDMDLLMEELEDLDFDGFDFDFPEVPEDDDEGYYGDERERTFESTNLNDVDLRRTAGKWQMPIIRAVKHVPKDLVSFNYVLSAKSGFDRGVHFYIDDYQFERIWNAPHQYIEALSQFDCVLTPDFSLYTEMPVAMQMWNIYRSRLVGQIMQDAGLKVIPTLSWCREVSFEFCFDGLEKGGTVSVSTIGVKQDKEATKLWIAGMDEAIRRLEPSHVVVYGGDIGYDFGCEATYISNHNAERLKDGR